MTERDQNAAVIDLLYSCTGSVTSCLAIQCQQSKPQKPLALDGVAVAVGGANVNGVGQPTLKS